MPLDINLLRTDRGGNPELVKESQRRRNASVELVDEIIAMDADWRRMTGDVDDAKMQRNSVQKEVGKKKKAKEECDDLVAEIKRIGEVIDGLEAQKAEMKIIIDKKLGSIGNIVDDSVPVHTNEDFNRVERTWGTCRDPAGLLNHHDLLWRIGGYEPERGVGVAGHRGYFLRDVGVMLNQAFINYGIAFLRKREYCVLQPPYLMKKDVMAGVAQLEQFDEELYKVTGDGEDKYLIATSEQPICGYHMNDWIEEKTLPLRYSGVSTCFRKEAGKHGADTWGIFRVHQFEKVEQFVIVDSDLEKSNAMQEEMIATAEEFYKSLGFPFQTINIVSGALNNAATRKYDLECWFPGYNAYRELVSCSNCTDYQSRAMEIRCGGKKMGDREKKYVHMLNSTLCATGRAICCLLENFQDANGVRVPDVLVPFMGGIDYLPFVRNARGDKTPFVANPVPAPSANPSNPNTGASSEVDELTAKVAEKGTQVREAKAAKKPKDEIDALVAELKALKADLSSKTLPTPPSAASDKDAKPKEEKKEKKEKTGPTGVTSPSYTSPAPTATRVMQTLPTSVWDGIDTISSDKLEKWLAYYSYVGGYMPSKDDIKASALVSTVDETNAPNTARWLRNIKSFNDADRASW